MPLAIRIIPMLLHSHGWLVKGIQFRSWRTAGHALQAARIHQARGVDELLFLDVAATPENRLSDVELLEKLTSGCFMPVTAGGGVRSASDMQDLLRHGADKVAIGAGCQIEGVVRQCADVAGSQAVVAVIEIMNQQVFFREPQINTDPVEWARHMENEGAGEILLMDRDRDGMCEGYDLEMIREVSRAVSIPVVAAGGAGTCEHMLQAVEMGASAVAGGSIFLWTDQTPRGVAQYMADHGVEVRL